ncbi:hypothetical protein BV911_17985 [Pseudoruegeria sp. SK021]|nr:hypothetical protein BV911_17985 [Pseudoruegeria sp. SK021]
MNVNLCHHLRLYFVVLLLAATSVTSAAMLAPDRTDAAIAQLALLGLSVDDICGDPLTHDHRCPYCHLLANTPIPSPGEFETQLLFMMSWKLSADLYRAAQARDHERSPRAPPYFV